MITQHARRCLLFFAFVCSYSSFLFAQGPSVLIEEQNLEEWTKIETAGKSICADGTPYHFYTRKGTVNKLVIWFQGGGACWNDLTCTVSLNPKGRGFYYSRVLPDMQEAVGIFDLDKEENPFRDWHFVYIPYCSGDLHLGDYTRTYRAIGGKEVEIAHRGAVNAQEALAWTFDHFNNLDKIFVAGKSAGGYGSIFWSKSVKEHYPETEVYQISDCSSVVSDSLQALMTNNWNPQLAADLNIKPSAALLADAFIAIGQQQSKKFHLAQINSIYDGVLIGYTGAMEENYFPDKTFGQRWSKTMQEATYHVANTIENFTYFNTDFEQSSKGTTPHTFLHHPMLYRVEENGIRLIDWLTNWIEGGEKQNVKGTD